jgi:hypothetical protein
MRRMLMEVSDDGSVMTLDDGSEWIVNPSDMPTACVWSPTASLEIRKAPVRSVFTHHILNCGMGMTILARRSITRESTTRRTRTTRRFRR